MTIESFLSLIDLQQHSPMITRMNIRELQTQKTIINKSIYIYSQKILMTYSYCKAQTNIICRDKTKTTNKNRQYYSCTDWDNTKEVKQSKSLWEVVLNWAFKVYNLENCLTQEFIIMRQILVTQQNLTSFTYRMDTAIVHFPLFYSMVIWWKCYMASQIISIHKHHLIHNKTSRDLKHSRIRFVLRNGE